MSQTEENGFTLIEIVMVLAISGLIVGLVFFAVPQAQRTRRDSQRKAYLTRLSANVERYKESVDNNYRYPASAAVFATAFQLTPSVGPYANTIESNDPSSRTPYTVSGLVTPVGATAAGIGYTPGSDCNGNASSGLYSLRIGIESGNNVFCLDNR